MTIHSSAPQLATPASYFPIRNGRYEVSPGLYPLASDFGNGLQDKKTFQLDNQFQMYYQQKLACRNEDLKKYFVTQSLPAEHLQTINHFILSTLLHEYPEYFSIETSAANSTLYAHLTQTRFELHDITEPQIQLDYFDFLAMQIQEDLAVLHLDNAGKNYVSLLHLCFPNYWSAAEKIGRDFLATHQPVAEFERVAQRANEIVNAMIHKGPFVRFAWGLTTDTRLNHHPVPPTGIEYETWQGRQFDVDNPALYLRIERQTIHGFPKLQAALFTIRTYFSDVATIKAKPAQCQTLITAIESMSEASLAYKGLHYSKQAIIEWLKN